VDVGRSPLIRGSIMNVATRRDLDASTQMLCTLPPTRVHQLSRHLLICRRQPCLSEIVWREQRRCYCELLDRKLQPLLAEQDAERTSQKQLWRLIDTLLGSGRQPTSDAINVDDFSHYFNDKVDAVHQSTERSPDPVFSVIPPGCNLLN